MGLKNILLTHWGWATHLCVSKPYHHWMAPSHYMNQCWYIVNWTLRKKFQWNFNQNSKSFIQENAFESVVCEMSAILSRPQCVKVAATSFRGHFTSSGHVRPEFINPYSKLLYFPSSFKTNMGPLTAKIYWPTYFFTGCRVSKLCKKILRIIVIYKH